MIKFLFWIIIILAIVYGFLWLLRFTVLRFKFKFNESGMWMVFGLPGSGKSTLCAEIVRQVKLWNIGTKLKKRFDQFISCFCNFPVRDALRVSRDMIGCVDFRSLIPGYSSPGDPHAGRALLLLDEASTVYFKRNAMAGRGSGSSKSDPDKFRNEENKFHSMHRHYKTMEIFFAQSWDGVDIRLRELSTDLFYVEPSRIRPFIKIRKIDKIFSISEDHQPIDGYDFVKFSSRYVYAPRAWKLFDTYDAPKLPACVPENWYE